MSDAAVASVETKLGALIDSLTADELEVFGSVLSEWREFDDSDDVEGFAHHANGSRGQLIGLLDGVVKQRADRRTTTPADLS